MIDLFGTEKVDAKESIEAMTRGMTTGLLDAYELRIMEKERKIEKLNNTIKELNNKIQNLSNSVGR